MPAIIISKMLAIIILQMLAIRFSEIIIIIAAADHHHPHDQLCGGQKRRIMSIYWISQNSINMYIEMFSTCLNLCQESSAPVRYNLTSE